MAARPQAPALSDTLRMVCPGTLLREGLEHVINARTGALIVIGDVENVARLCNGGFLLNAELTPQRLFELSKMDGAIVLDENLTTVIRANVHLVPDSGLPTSETGMRHRTAERVARQTKALVISVSQRRDVVSLYVGDAKYVLQDLRVVLAKANQALQTLEKFKARLEEVCSNLTALEFDDLVTLQDVVNVVQRGEMMRRVSREVDRYIIELGSEGRLIGMQRVELMAGAEEDALAVVRDYCRPLRRAERALDGLAALASDELLDPQVIGRVLGYDMAAGMLERVVHPRGYRLLNKIPRLPDAVVSSLVERFRTLPAVLKASIEQLDMVDGVGEVRARAIQAGLGRIREYNQPTRPV